MKKKINIALLLYIFITLSFIVPIVYLIFKIMTGGAAENEAGFHSSADYALMIVQCVLGLAVMNIPQIASKRLRFDIPIPLYVMYIVFLYCAIFLGEVRSFFYLVPHWDVVLHAFSGLMSGFLGFMLITVLNRNENLVFQLSPIFAAFFAFCFSVALGALWEIYEYVFDGLLGLNMQKFMLADGTVLSGHAALTDTMKDVIVDSVSALISSSVGYFMLKHEKRWMLPILHSDEEQSVAHLRQPSLGRLKARIRIRLTKKDVLTIPNALSLFRLLLIPLMLFLYMKKQMYSATLICFFISILTDLLDGIIARRFNMVSDLGKVLDPVADKATHVALFICLAVRYPAIWALVLIFVLKELLMLAVGFTVLQRTDTVNSARWYGKLATNIIDAGIIALFVFPNLSSTAVNAVIAICIGAVLFSLLLYLRYYIKLLLSAGRTGKPHQTIETSDADTESE